MEKHLGGQMPPRELRANSAASSCIRWSGKTSGDHLPANIPENDVPENGNTHCFGEDVRGQSGRGECTELASYYLRFQTLRYYAG